MAAGAGIVALALTLVVALPTFAIAWFWHRPVLSIVLIVAGFAGAYGLKLLGERRRAAAPRPAVAPTPTGLGGQQAWPPQAAAPQGWQQQQAPAPQGWGQPAPQQPSGFLNVPQGLRPGQQ